MNRGTGRTPWLPEVARAVGYARSEREAMAGRKNLELARAAKRLRMELKKEIEKS